VAKRNKSQPIEIVRHYEPDEERIRTILMLLLARGDDYGWQLLREQVLAEEVCSESAAPED
jgi:hypothetical protein